MKVSIRSGAPWSVISAWPSDETPAAWLVLKMNLTYPSSLCTVQSDLGHALCEIEEGPWQRRPLPRLLSTLEL